MSFKDEKQEVLISVLNVSKKFKLFPRPSSRLKQLLFSSFKSIFIGREIRYYDEFEVLKDVSFDVVKGETFGILGQNGSGKSTLLQIVCGTMSQSKGMIDIKGRVAALLELGAGFNPEFTGRENIFMNASILGLNQAEIEAKYDQIVEFSELEKFIDQPIKTYSSGMYVRLAFSIAINVSPNILVIDEALSVGDVRFQAKCMGKIRELQSAGTSILFVSHDVTIVRSICQKALWLHEGKVRMLGDVFTVTGSYMEYMYRASDNRIDSPSSAELTSPTNSKPITHWGSHAGKVIKSAGIYNKSGIKTSVFRWNEEMKVSLSFEIIDGLDPKHLYASISLKDCKGTDLIVSTIHDFNEQMLTNNSKKKTIEFTFNNTLVSGNYLLVAAIEDRSSQSIHYYEYIEGIQYFSSYSDDKFNGIFQPVIHQAVKDYI